MAASTLTWTGIAACALGSAGLVTVAFVDLGSADQLASVGGGVLALLGFAVALWSRRTGTAPEPDGTPPPTVTASGERSVAAGGSIGSVATGDGAAASPPAPAPAPAPAPTPAPAPAPAPAPGPAPGTPPPTVTASGNRSVAAGGSVGSASTGDGTPAPNTPAPNTPTPAAPTPPAPPAPGTTQATGDRSIAAGGDIGSAATGDA
ncbi:hypothetical protein [Streptomyces sp. NPDC059009]|uniref:hypothetical protein n=1 Tax=Streptomyces sp. NPDC059009 TaxID=3346694 RepID=UPI00369EB5A8